MNALKTFAHQIETFGTFIQEIKSPTLTHRYYRIDTVTMAIVSRNEKGKIVTAKFYYQ